MCQKTASSAELEVRKSQLFEWQLLDIISSFTWYYEGGHRPVLFLPTAAGNSWCPVKAAWQTTPIADHTAEGLIKSLFYPLPSCPDASLFFPAGLVTGLTHRYIDCGLMWGVMARLNAIACHTHMSLLFFFYSSLLGTTGQMGVLTKGGGGGAGVVLLVLIDIRDVMFICDSGMYCHVSVHASSSPCWGTLNKWLWIKDFAVGTGLEVVMMSCLSVSLNANVCECPAMEIVVLGPGDRYWEAC